MSIPSEISTYISLSSNAIIGAFDEARGKIVFDFDDGLARKYISLLGLDDDDQIGYEFLYSGSDGGIFRYRYGPDTVTLIDIDSSGIVTVFAQNVVTRVLNVNKDPTGAAGVSLYIDETTGDGGFAVNTGVGDIRIIAGVDTLTQEGSIRIYYDDGALTEGTYLDAYSVSTRGIGASSIDVAENIIMHSITDLSIVGSLTLDDNKILYVDTVPVGASISTFSTLILSSFLEVQTISAQEIFTSSISGYAPAVIVDYKFHILGGNGNSPIWASPDLTDQPSFSLPSTNGYFDSTGTKIYLDEANLVNIATGVDRFNKCSTIQIMTGGDNKWTYISQGHPFINRANTVTHIGDKWFVGGIPSSLSAGTPIIYSDDLDPTDFSYSAENFNFPDNIKREVNAITALDGTYVIGLPMSTIGVSITNDILLYSDDLENWSKADSMDYQFLTEVRALASSADEGLIIAGGVSLSPGEGSIAISPDGKNWQAKDISFINYINTIEYANGRWIAGGKPTGSGNRSSIAYSDDGGLTWEHPGTVFDASEVFSIRYIDTTWYATTTNNILTSDDDGINWTTLLPSTFFANQTRDISYSFNYEYDQAYLDFDSQTIVNMGTMNLSTGYISTIDSDRISAPIMYNIQTITF